MLLASWAAFAQSVRHDLPPISSPNGITVPPGGSIQKAINALSAKGGTIILTPGIYNADAFPLTIAKPLHIIGAGMPDSADVANGTTTHSPCIIQVPAATIGIQITGTAYEVVLENFWLRGSSTVLGTDDGVQVRAHTTLRNLVVTSFGRDGVNIDTSASGNANLSEVDNVWSAYNKRRGFYFHGANSNKLNIVNTSATDNTDWGYYTDSNQNVFVGPHAETNAGGAYYINGAGNAYYSPYVEQVSASNAVALGINASGTFYKATQGSAGTITNAGVNNFQNQILYQGPSNFQVWNGLRISTIDPQATGATVYSMDSGRQATSTWSLRDDTNTTTFAQYNVSGRWQFLQNAGWARGALAHVYNGISTAGNGLAAVYGATSQRTEETGADSNVLTFTPPATAGSYRIRFVMSVSAANAATLGWTASWTDSNGNAQTPTNLSLFQSGAAAPALTFTTSAAGNYYGYADVDVNNSGTAIVVKLTFSGTSFTAKVSATIERLI